MNKMISWNTGRTYTKRGQRIAAMITEWGVSFLDEDRMIDGHFPFAGRELAKEEVMFAYDHFMYQHGVAPIGVTWERMNEVRSLLMEAAKAAV